jgi:hypothetical protein
MTTTRWGLMLLLLLVIVVNLLYPPPGPVTQKLFVLVCVGLILGMKWWVRR